MTSHAVALRCSVHNWTESAATGAQDLKAAVPKQLRTKVLKLTEKYIGTSKLPEWMKEMKSEVEIEMEAAAAKDEAKSAATGAKDAAASGSKGDEAGAAKGDDAATTGDGAADTVAESQQAAATGATAGAAAQGFKDGDEVVLSAKKQKTFYDGRRAKIIAVLSQHLKIEMLGGPRCGEVLKRPVGAFSRAKGKDDGVAAFLVAADTGAKDVAAGATSAATGAPTSAATGAPTSAATGAPTSEAAGAGNDAGDGDDAWGSCEDIFGSTEDVQ